MIISCHQFVRLKIGWQKCIQAKSLVVEIHLINTNASLLKIQQAVSLNKQKKPGISYRCRLCTVNLCIGITTDICNAKTRQFPATLRLISAALL